MATYNQAKKLLDTWFNAPTNEWGGKGYLVDRLARELSISKAQAARFHSQWVALN